MNGVQERGNVDFTTFFEPIRENQIFTTYIR